MYTVLKQLKQLCYTDTSFNVQMIYDFCWLWICLRDCHFRADGAKTEVENMKILAPRRRMSLGPVGLGSGVGIPRFPL